jgi:hypothetical protein
MKTFSRSVLSATLAAAVLLAGCTSTPEADPVTTDPGITDPDDEPVDEPDGVEQPGEDGTHLARIYIDGWSLRSLGSDALSIDLDDATLPLRFAPVGRDGLEQLLRERPEYLTTTVSRMVDAAAEVSCVAEGCVVAGQPLELDQLADAATIPGFGEVYDAWGVRAVLYVAEVPTGEAKRAAVRNTYRSSLPVPLPGGPLLDEEDLDAELEAADIDEADTDGSVLVAAAFGRLFEPVVTWTGTEPQAYELPAELLDAADEFDASSDLPLFDGLGAAVLGAATLTPSQLTYYSSPTTGCGLVALCVPGLATEVTVTVADATTVELCPAEGDGPATHARFVDARVEVELRRPIVQRGAINGLSDWEGKDTNPLISGGQRPRLSGRDELRVVTLTVHSQAGGIHDLAGLMRQRSTDADYDAAVGFDEVLDTLLPAWRSC